jgi:hypothetical protein
MMVSSPVPLSMHNSNTVHLQDINEEVEDAASIMNNGGSGSVGVY